MLKSNKARDAHGHVYELFKRGGQALKSSLLKLLNLVKQKQVYPDILQPSNISSLYTSQKEGKMISITIGECSMLLKFGLYWTS